MMKEAMATLSPHIPPKPAIIGFAAVFVLLIVIGGIALTRGIHTTPQPGNTPTAISKESPRSFDPINTPATDDTITQSPTMRKLLHIYAIESALPRKVGDLTIIENGRDISLRMDDNGVIYYIEKQNVYSYSLASQEKRLMYTNTDTSYAVIDAIMSRTGKLYVTLQNMEATDGLPHYSVTEDTLSAGKTRVIGPLSPTVYGTLTYMFKTDYGDILISTGKENCATYGIIIKVQDEAKEVKRIGEGCVDDPRLVGYNEDIATIYLSKAKADTYPDTEYDSFDSLNMVSEQTAQEYDLTSIGNPVRQVLMDGTTAAFLTDSYAMLFNIDNKTVGAKISIPKYSEYRWVLNGTSLYGSARNDGPNIVVDMNTGSIRNIVQTNMDSKKTSFKYLGSWKKRPIFYVDATE